MQLIETPSGSPAPLDPDQLADALDAPGVGAWQWDIATNALIWSTSLQRIHGFEPGMFSGTFAAFEHALHPDDRERVKGALTAAAETRAPFSVEYRTVTPAGETRWIDVRGKVFTNSQGEALRILGIGLDVTSRHKDDGALERARQDVVEYARLAALTADIGAAITSADSLDAMLGRATNALVTHLEVAFARVWTLNAADQVLELRASSGMYTHLDGAHGRVPVGKFKIGLIAEERRPHLTNQVIGDPRVGDQEWARRERMVAFAGYPLLVGDELIGVLAMFARRPLADSDFQCLRSVADALAAGISRARTQQVLRESEQRYRVLTELMPVQVWTTTPEGQFLYMNQRGLEFFGLDLSEIGVHNAAALVHPEDLEPTVATFTESLREGRPFNMEQRIRRADGQYRWHRSRGRPVKDAHGQVIQWIGVNIDVDDYKVLQQSLEERANELARTALELERINRELDQFAYVASHDLKAPLRGIASLAGWIADDVGDAAPPSVRENVALLLGRVQRMENLINGVLEYSRAGRVRTEGERIDTGELVAGVVDLLGRPPHVAFEVSDDLPTIVTERLPLEQVFLNLIGNAIKHNTAPGARVTVSWRDAGTHVQFTVADNGPGIASEYHERIWGIFQTLAPRDSVEGTGIGLALVRKVVESRGGRTWVDSKPGAGAMFQFTWPKRPERL